ncbi:unnamed protein product [Adineta steineri]|uniref:Acyl-coenzyme A oxidase n=2 Tax=Adineta steineri TaxID=433720 RepID=A0A818N9Z0_9BILA|nr:unnamed protein product [Adineta steineri]CAF0920641.1 unnamed protein product [Adineta steineri]CAF3601981.1 unnamed protein product [Adineta steineri]
MVESQDQGPYYQLNDTKNPDLLRERQSATFDVEELTQFVFGGPNSYFNVNRRRQLTRLAYAHPVHDTHLPIEYLDADDYYSVLIRKSFIAIKEAERYGITDRKLLGWFVSVFTNGRFMFGLHTSMFLHTLETMASDEQQEKFLPLARSFQIIGTYAQTELGHGSNLQRLETEAVFDINTDTFVLNTPTITATKFWPGALGRSTNYVLLMAQLFTPDRNHPAGLQMFFVQIRDLNTHEPLPGVELGEISTRFGHEVGDNGYLRLHNVRIPRNHMLMKLAYVDEQGTFHRLGDPRLLYGTMLATRVNLCAYFSILLARAITIAMRYSAVRRQGQNPNGKETLILDYPLQQEKLVPCIATNYAFFYAFIKLENLRREILDSDTILFELLPELHAVSSGLKAYMSSIGERFSQTCRVACGGHGYLVASGIKGLNNQLDAGCTYEGDNSVLYQQTARYLLKVMQQLDEISEMETESSIKFLYSTTTPPATIINLDDYCRLFECRSQMLLKSMSNRLSESEASTYNKFSKNSIELVHISKAFIETVVLRAFYDGVRKASEHKSFGPVFEQLFHVFAIHTLRNSATDFIRLKLLTADQIYQLETFNLPDMYARLRPNLISLVDAFDFHDNELNSCLGRYDGQVYEALMERARLNPTNRHKVHPVWKSIKQETKSKL